MKPDFDSRNTLQCIIKVYLTRSIFIITTRIITAIELSLGGSSPYTSTSKTNKNKYIKETIQKHIKTIQNTVNTRTHITKTPKKITKHVNTTAVQDKYQMK
jgi:predicted oxidoreductase